jgi:hypothetical protein
MIIQQLYNIMFQLNPYGLTDAWWQHLIILFVSGIIGYIIGHRRGSAIIISLEERLSTLRVDLAKCRKGLLGASTAQSVAFVDKMDDFKLIEGIGPGIERVLYRAGIKNYEQLSKFSSVEIKNILNTAGPHFTMHDPGTWPRQAALAHAGKWQELREWQEKLDGGVE